MLPLLKECHHTCMTLSIVRHPKPEFTVSRVSTKTGCNGKITHPGVSTAAWVVGSSPTGAPGHPVRQDTWDLMGYCAWHCCLADGGRDPSTSPFPLSDALFLRASPDHPEVHQAHTQFVGNDYGIPDCDGCTPFLCVPSLPSFPVSYRFAPHAQKKTVCNSDVPGRRTMKLSKAQNNWVKQLVEDSTSKEREKLKRKEKAIARFASALMSWSESTEMGPSTRPRLEKAARRYQRACISAMPNRTSSCPVPPANSASIKPLQQNHKSRRTEFD